MIFAPEEEPVLARGQHARDYRNRLAASAEPVDSVLLDLELTNVLDVPSADMLKDLDADLDAAGVQLMLARVRPAVRNLLDRSGVTEAIGEDPTLRSRAGRRAGSPEHGRNPRETFLGLSTDTLKRVQQAIDDVTARPWRSAGRAGLSRPS
ncbi:MAG: sodium-independent anion transporter [Caldilineales bacterium]